MRGRLVTLDEAIVLAGVHRSTILRWVQAGLLEAFMTDERGRRLYLDREVYAARRERMHGPA